VTHRASNKLDRTFSEHNSDKPAICDTRFTTWKDLDCGISFVQQIDAEGVQSLGPNVK